MKTIFISCWFNQKVLVHTWKDFWTVDNVLNTSYSDFQKPIYVALSGFRKPFRDSTNVF